MRRSTHPVAASKDIRRIQRTACSDKAKLLLSVIRAGHRYKMTKAGIVIYGPDGIAGTHLAGSDHRGLANFRSDLRKSGITLKEKT